MSGAGREYLRFHLGRRIAADHVLDGQAAAGVTGQPSVELEHEVLEDDNRVSVGDHVLDHPWRQHLVALRDGGHGGVGGVDLGEERKPTGSRFNQLLLASGEIFDGSGRGGRECRGRMCV